mmetsp:Transcript_55545/g.132401  ORF Transcript_55545/g.132401 Transcript_55545/m.132401 type:complete len:286 (-) Transcript_55545:43-900(-)
MEHYQKSLAVCADQGEHFPRVANTHHNLGLICQQQGRLDEAAEHCQKALAMRLQAHGDQKEHPHPDVADSYHRIGMIFKEQGCLDEAMDHYQKSLAIQLRGAVVHEPCDLSIADSYHDMGVICQKQGRLDEAMAHCQKSLALILQIYGDQEDHPHAHVASSYCSIGAIYAEQHKWELARESLQRSLKIYMASLGELHAETLQVKKLLRHVSVHRRLDRAVSALGRLCFCSCFHSAPSTQAGTAPSFAAQADEDDRLRKSEQQDLVQQQLPGAADPAAALRNLGRV